MERCCTTILLIPALRIVTQPLPKWIKPQLARLVEEAPNGKDWPHEVKCDGYRIHARMERSRIKLPTRTGLDWSHRYRRRARRLGPVLLSR
jgi:ATP-dependent DNA ligase